MNHYEEKLAYASRAVALDGNCCSCGRLKSESQQELTKLRAVLEELCVKREIKAVKNEIKHLQRELED